MTEISEDMKAILDTLPSDGSMIGNRKLMKLLKMAPDRFFQAKKLLLLQRYIQRGKGKGGSIGLRKDSGGFNIKEKEEQDQKLIPEKHPISSISEKIMESLPSDGSMIGNTYLMRRLGLTPEDFFKAKATLIEDNKVITGKGKGGSIGLATPDVSEPKEPPPLRAVKNEPMLYEPVKKYFESRWGPEYRATGSLFDAVISRTPKGYKRKSGLWSRPDISVITISRYDYLPTIRLEVTTVEVKRYKDASPVAVFETASHHKFAHFAYLVVEWVEDVDMESSVDENIKRVFKEAERFGVGIMQMRKNEKEEWDFKEVLEPQRREPDPDACDNFIKMVFPETTKKNILFNLGKR